MDYADHGDRAVVIQERRVHDGAGGLWFELEQGGWTNDFWLTEVPCNENNLDEFAQEC